MAAAFTLTLAYLGERCSTADAAGALAAYVTGNVASNLFGRLLSAAVADHLGLAANFYVFALLNLSGAVLVWFWIGRTPSMMAMGRPAGIAARDLGRASAQRAAAPGVRDRLFDPVRLHRHLHLRQLRADPRAAFGEPDGAGLRLLRLPAIDLHHPACRPGRAPASAPGPLSGAPWA